MARAIQHLSRRRDRLFEILNCADMTRELLRSELFGHERGAFIGAVSRSAGLVSRLDGGTYATYWGADPKEQMVVVSMMQSPLGRHYTQLVRALVYQAIVE